MPELYARTTVAVCRAGAATVAELAAAGVPSVLVPLPGAPGDHQTRNAMAMVEARAAVLVPDADCTGERLAAELEPLLADPARLEAMAAAASTLARPDAAAGLADLVERRRLPAAVPHRRSAPERRRPGAVTATGTFVTPGDTPDPGVVGGRPRSPEGRW